MTARGMAPNTVNTRWYVALVAFLTSGSDQPHMLCGFQAFSRNPLEAPITAVGSCRGGGGGPDEGAHRRDAHRGDEGTDPVAEPGGRWGWHHTSGSATGPSTGAGAAIAGVVSR